jgi:hypothetical protein
MASAAGGAKHPTDDAASPRRASKTSTRFNSAARNWTPAFAGVD